MQLVQMKKKNSPVTLLMVIEDNWSADHIDAILSKKHIKDWDRYFEQRSIRLFDGDLNVIPGRVWLEVE